MSSTSRAWMVTASMSTVEALKDQGFCRWNYTLRSLHHHAKSNLGSMSQAQSFSSVGRWKEGDLDEAKQSDESLRKVMYLSCWGPN